MLLFIAFTVCLRYLKKNVYRILFIQRRKFRRILGKVPSNFWLDFFSIQKFANINDSDSIVSLRSNVVELTYRAYSVLQLFCINFSLW